jgi:hypothetical protein
MDNERFDCNKQLKSERCAALGDDVWGGEVEVEIEAREELE